MKAFVPYLLWNDQQIEINSLQELERIINILIAENQEIPVAIQLVVNEKTGMLITVGSENSHTEFYSEDSRPPVSISHGGNEGEDLVYFFHGGVLSSAPRKTCIPFILAMEALQKYYLTGEKPNTLSWF